MFCDLCSSSNCKPVVRSHGRKWIYEVSTVTHEEQVSNLKPNILSELAAMVDLYFGCSSLLVSLIIFIDDLNDIQR